MAARPGGYQLTAADTYARFNDPYTWESRPGIAAIVCPELVVKVNYLTWTFDNLLRQVAHVGLREDKPARDVQRPMPHPKAR
jgi:ATP-dependent DNA ligase